MQNLVYPAVLTALGVAGNAYILGGEIKGMKDDLRGLIHEMKGDVEEMKGDLKEMKGDMEEMKDDIKGLIRQTELEVQDMARVEKLVRDCGKKR